MNKIRALKPISILLYVIWSFLVLELGLWIFLTAYRFQFRFSDAGSFTLNDEQIAQLSRIYDEDLGWKELNLTPFGERPNSSELSSHGKGPLAIGGLSYGDSFTYGYEVNDQETWQSILGQKVGQRFLNFGVGGYGLDQAILFFEKSGAKLPGKYVFLGLMPGQISRSFNIYRHFLRGQEVGKPLTKPRFDLQNGVLRLIKNPITNATELGLLKSPEYIRRLEPLDWERSHFGSGYPPNSFPRIRILFNPEFYRQLRGFYQQPPEDVIEELTRKLLVRFKDSACKQGKAPVVVLFPDQGLLKNHSLYQAWGTRLLGYCKDAMLRCYFPGEDFYTQNHRESLFSSGGHYNATGNALIANLLYEGLTHPNVPDGQPVKDSQVCK